jgi:hypothetical protein
MTDGSDPDSGTVRAQLIDDTVRADSQGAEPPEPAPQQVSRVRFPLQHGQSLNNCLG